MIIHLRNLIKQYFKVARVYHTYLVRCQPKACPTTQGIDCCPANRLLDQNNTCLLTSGVCAGIPIKPNDEETLNCLTFLMEEINILKPGYVILLGHGVTNFVLKSFGRFEADSDVPVYRYDDTIFLSSDAADILQDAEIQRLAALISKQ